MKVFITYGTGADQVTALRLQALGAVNGLSVYVPPPFTRQASHVLTEEPAQKLNQADVVLGVVGAGLSDACRQELQACRATQKPTTVIAAPHLAKELEPYFGTDITVVDAANPHAVVQHLQDIRAEKESKDALVALGTVALGLFLLARLGAPE
jgi:hypothetical protein